MFELERTLASVEYLRRARYFIHPNDSIQVWNSDDAQSALSVEEKLAMLNSWNAPIRTANSVVVSATFQLKSVLIVLAARIRLWKEHVPMRNEYYLSFHPLLGKRKKRETIHFALERVLSSGEHDNVILIPFYSSINISR